jgi:hypothetical protein
MIYIKVQLIVHQKFSNNMELEGYIKVNDIRFSNFIYLLIIFLY